MRNSKLIDLLKQLSKRELSRFRDFVASPYYNKSEEVSLFLNFLSTHYPGFRSATLEKENVLTQIFPEKKITERKLNYLMNELTGLLDEFFIAEMSGKEKSESFLTLVDIYKTKNAEAKYKSTASKLKRLFETNEKNTAQNHYHKYKFHDIQLTHTARKIIRKYDPQMQEVTDELDAFYLAEKFKYSFEQISRNNIINAGYETHGINELERWVERTFDRQPVLVRFYFLMYKMIKSPEEQEHLGAASSFMISRQNAIAKEDLMYGYNSLLNFCIRRMNGGDNSFARHYIEISQQQIKSGMLLEDGTLTPGRYKNIVAAGLRIQKQEWTLNFIEEFKQYIPTDSRQNAYTFCLASWHFECGNHEKTHELLIGIELEDTLQTTSYKNLFLRTLYATDNELLTSFADAYLVFLNRKSDLTAVKRKPMVSFVRAVKKLGNLLSTDNDGLEKLEANIVADKTIIQKNWLLEMIKEKAGRKGPA